MYKTDEFANTRPNVGVTIAPFIYKDGKIKVLVYKRASNAAVYQDQYSLPNRFFNITEYQNLEEAAYYALEEKTNVTIPHMTQFHTFSGQYIDPTRIITVNACYYSILRESEVFKLVDKKQPFETEWINVEDALELEMAFNHNEVLSLAYKRLKASAEYTVAPIHFLDDKFVISDLRDLTSLLIEQKIDNSRFRSRVEKSGILSICKGEKQHKKTHRPAQFYKLNTDYTGNFYPKSLTSTN